MTTKPVPPAETAPTLAGRNRRTAFVLVGWIAFLALVAVAVAWFRN